MSGLEVIGIAASIVQIAEIGTQLAVKLCAFYHKIKTADQRIQNLSNNVALTSSVLKLLGDNLQKDEQAKLYSKQAFGTTQGVLDECKSVFEQIRNALDQSPSKGLFQRAAKKLSFVAMEDELELLGRNLERLKSTLHLMLNVIMYAGQLRSRTEPTALKDQRELIQSLLDHKRITERRFEEMTKALEGAQLNNDQPKDLQAEHFMSAAALPTPTNNPLADLGKYYLLVKKLLEDVDSYRASVEQSRHSRVRNGVLRIHNEEIQHMEVSHGPQMAQMFRNRIYELSDRPAEIEKHIFGSSPHADIGPPKPVGAYPPEPESIPQPQIPSQAPSRYFRGRSTEVLAEAHQQITPNRPNSTKPPYQPAPVPQSPAPVQNQTPSPFQDTIRALSRLSPAQLSHLDRVADAIRDRTEKPALERIEARLHKVNPGEYDGDIVQLFFRHHALGQLRKRQRQSATRTDSIGSPVVEPRNPTTGDPPDIYGQPSQQQQQPPTNPISVYPSTPGYVNLDDSHWFTQPDALVKKKRGGRPSPIIARQPSPYGGQYADPLGRPEPLFAPTPVSDSLVPSSLGVPHRRSKSDTYASLINSGEFDMPGYEFRGTGQQQPILPVHGSPSREQERDDSTRGKRRERGSRYDNSTTNPSSSVPQKPSDTPPQAVDSPISKAVPDEIDDLVLQWTTVGGDEIASALRVD